MNCNKCGKFVDAHYAFSFNAAGEVVHIECNDIKERNVDHLKPGPVFDTATPNERQIEQEKIYTNS